MGALTDARKDIADVLNDVGVTTYHYIPSRLTPSTAVVSAGSPYLTSGKAFGSFEVRWVVSVITSVGANDLSSDNLDNLVENTVIALANSDYLIEQVSQPYAEDKNNAQFAVVDVTITRNVRI